MNNLIEKLKDKTYVRAFGLMSVDERRCFRVVGRTKCGCYVNNRWNFEDTGESNTFDDDCTYAIKPDYKPEPEYVDLEIKVHNDEDIKWLGVYNNDAPSGLMPYFFTHLHCLPSLPNFERFYLEDKGVKWPTVTEDIATRIDEGETVYARFRTNSSHTT